ncbi:hypothetical protein ACFFRR_002966 [Megaselia abdita]
MSTNVNVKMRIEEEIFLYVNYKNQSNYIKISFKSHDEYHLILVKEAISAAFEGFYVDSCDFYWDQVMIPEKDLVKLIKAKQFCGHFRIALKDKCPEIAEQLPSVEEIPIPQVLEKEKSPEPTKNVKVTLAKPSSSKELKDEDVIHLDEDTNDRCLDVKVHNLNTAEEEIPVSLNIGSFIKIEAPIIDSDSDEPLGKKLKIASVRSEGESDHFSLSVKRPRIKPKKKRSFNEPFKDKVVKFKNYFNSNLQTKIFLLNDPTTLYNRKNIINTAVKFLFDEVGLYPDSAERHCLVKLLVEVFKPYRKDEDLVVKWVQDKISNLRKNIKTDEKNISRLLENSKKRNREESEPEDSEEDNESSFSYSYSGCSLLTLSKFKEYMNSDIKNRLVLLEDTDHTEFSIRKKIIACAVQFMFKEVGMYPSSSHKLDLIRIIMETFSGLRGDEDQLKRWIQDRIVNCRRRSKQIADSYNESLDRVRVLTGAMSLEEQMKFLENCTAIDDIEKIQEVLKDTLGQRIEQNFIAEFSVFNTYKFFSQSLDLIKYDFSLRFPFVEENVLDNFELILDASSNLFALESKHDLKEEDFDTDIRKFLYIFHFTKTPVGAKKPFTIQDMLENFIIFSTVSNCSEKLSI